uniref:Uncharacterized protein n=1 Tax=Arundo donax TaxID=35708 RepID=A0A0A9ERD5_ARUDO
MQKVVYGAKAEVAVAAGLDASTPDAFVEYYQKYCMEIRQSEGDAARIAEQVFVKTEGAWFVKAEGTSQCPRFCCFWN